MPDEPSGVRPFDQLLAAVPAGDDVFRTSLESYGGVSFGGQTLGCATLAAARTCARRPLHSLHAVFLRPVPPAKAVDFRVERVRDGRRFTHRRVRVCYGERVLCEVLASFASAVEGESFGDAIRKHDVPAPESLPDDVSVARSEGWSQWSAGPLEWRWIGTPWRPGADEASRHFAWVRPRWTLAPDPALRPAVLAYLADSYSHWPVARMRRRDFEPAGFVSLDQAIWIHWDEPWEDWRLITSECDVAHGGRALSRRQLHARDGRLIASMAQEALLPD